jgi:hypothetical protein
MFFFFSVPGDPDEKLWFDLVRFVYFPIIAVYFFHVNAVRCECGVVVVGAEGEGGGINASINVCSHHPIRIAIQPQNPKFWLVYSNSSRPRSSYPSFLPSFPPKQIRIPIKLQTPSAALPLPAKEREPRHSVSASLNTLHNLTFPRYSSSFFLVSLETFVSDASSWIKSSTVRESWILDPHVAFPGHLYRDIDDSVGSARDRDGILSLLIIQRL